MATLLNGVVVSDILFKEYHNFKNGINCNIEMIKRLLHYYKHEIVSNVGQYERNKVDLSQSLKSRLTYSGLKRQPLEDLAENNTFYKIILNTERNDFPYINIMDDNERLENNFSSSFDVTETRERALDHLTALCKHANEIIIYDKYFSKNSDTIHSLAGILPQKRIEIHYYYDNAKDQGINDVDIQTLKNQWQGWNFIKDIRICQRHDRYLIIDNQLEVILSSGFDHLVNNTGDFTYLLRSITTNRFQ